jgi:hypothetical protein
MRSDDVLFYFFGLDVVVCSLLRKTSLESIRFGSGPRPDRRHVYAGVVDHLDRRIIKSIYVAEASELCIFFFWGTVVMISSSWSP